MLGGLNLKETELCLGLPGAEVNGQLPAAAAVSGAGNKRGYSETVDLKLNLHQPKNDEDGSVKNDEDDDSNVISKEKIIHASSKDPAKPPAKAQVVGWPPVRSYRKNVMVGRSDGGDGASVAFVKVSMDGAPYLRKVDLKMYKTYKDLSHALTKMFSSFTNGNYEAQGMIDFMNESKLMDVLNSSDYVPTYEDKDGDWMLVGDVPWEMFVESCKRLRIMKGSEAIGLAPRAMEKCKNRV